MVEKEMKLIEIISFNEICDLKPMTLDEFYSMIDQAEEDIKNGRVIETKELLKKVHSWK